MKGKCLLCVLLVVPIYIFGLTEVPFQIDVVKPFNVYYPTFASGIRTIYGENCYLTASYYGAYGETYYDPAYGFYYNLTVMNPSDHNSGYWGYTDSPEGAYQNNLNISCGLQNTVLIPSNNTQCKLKFYAHWNIEDYDDGLQVKLSRDGGTSWISLRGTHMVKGSGYGCQEKTDEYYYAGTYGGYNDYLYEECDITPYIGNNILIKFQLRTDNSNPSPFDGFYLDDLTIEGDVSGVLYRVDFDDNFSNWYGDAPWGKTIATSGKSLLSTFGQFAAGTSPSYVSIAGYKQENNDWNPDGQWQNSPVPNCRFYNKKAPQNGPKMWVLELCYASDDFIILDLYLYNNSNTYNIQNLYIGYQMELDVCHTIFDTPYNDRARYDPNLRMCYMFNDGQENKVCVGMVFLSETPKSVNIYDSSNYNVFTDISKIYQYIANGEIDYVPTPDVAGNWAMAMGVGPINLNPGGVKRISYAIVGGNNKSDLEYNANRAFSYYKQYCPDRSNIESTSLGNIRALFY
ncbi:MAG: hypothetical protein ACUVWP_01900 [bacterium]